MILYGYVAYEWVKGGVGRKYADYFLRNIAKLPPSIGASTTELYDLVTPISRRIEKLAGLRNGAIKYNYNIRSYARKYSDLLGTENAAEVADQPAPDINLAQVGAQSSGYKRKMVSSYFTSALYIDLEAIDKIVQFGSGEYAPHKVYLLSLIATCIAIGQASFLSLTTRNEFAKINEGISYRSIISKTRLGTLITIKGKPWRGMQQPDAEGATYNQPAEQVLNASPTFINGFKQMIINYPGLQMSDSNQLITGLNRLAAITKLQK